MRSNALPTQISNHWFWTKVLLEIFNPIRNETNTVELTRQKFTTANS